MTLIARLLTRLHGTRICVADQIGMTPSVVFSHIAIRLFILQQNMPAF